MSNLDKEAEDLYVRTAFPGGRPPNVDVWNTLHERAKEGWRQRVRDQRPTFVPLTPAKTGRPTAK